MFNTIKFKYINIKIFKESEVVCDSKFLLSLSSFFLFFLLLRQRFTSDFRTIAESWLACSQVTNCSFLIGRGFIRFESKRLINLKKFGQRNENKKNIITERI